MSSQITSPLFQARYVPLAEQMRPTAWAEFLTAGIRDKAFLKQLRTGEGPVPSVVLWGPPGVGKTTLARLIGRTYPVRFVELSATLSGVKEVRAVVDEAQEHTEQTVLFIDEIHRFTRSQQDAFLPSIERGTIALIGATTENPSFHLNAALLSRVRVVVLGGVPLDDCRAIVMRALDRLGTAVSDDIVEAIAHACDGDVRALIGMVEEVQANSGDNQHELLAQIKARVRVRHDRAGDNHYDTISAFIKCLRASRVDAALFWGFRMLEAGEDPAFLLRRMIVFASEDIGNSDPRALLLAVATAEAFDRIGLPEAKIPVAQCITYLATAPKSNRSYVAMKRAISAVQQHPSAQIPSQLKNAPTKLMKELGNAAGYVYPHDCVDAIEPDGRYLPVEVGQTDYYEPCDRGYEKTIGERMAWVQSRIDGLQQKG